MKWVEISALVDREGAEAASELLNRFAYGGVALEEVATRRGPPRLTVRAYLPADETAKEKRRALRDAWWHLSRVRPLGRLRSRMMDEEDWSEAWKKHFVVHRPARHVVIKPSWLEYPPQPGEVVVELDPGAAFGTGLHPTTMLCLEALEDIVRPGMRVYDVGTGSGILAIAAARLGAARVVAVDTDPVAVRVARENVERNGLGGRVEVAEGSATPEVSGGFDLVLANIVANTIVQLAPSLRAALRPGGALVVSGIIRGRTPEVRAALRAAGLRNIVSRRSGDWLALRAERDGPA